MASSIDYYPLKTNWIWTQLLKESIKDSYHLIPITNFNLSNLAIKSSDQTQTSHPLDNLSPYHRPLAHHHYQVLEGLNKVYYYQLVEKYFDQSYQNSDM